LVVNGWSLFYLRLFADILNRLERNVAELADQDPVAYVHHERAKLLKSVYDSIEKDVPSNPDDPKFRLGKTLGDRFTDWRRVKHGLPPRYRLFFKFTSARRKIVYAWLNDERTLRKKGARTDVYEAFKRMLRRGSVPDTVEELLRSAVPPEQRTSRAIAAEQHK
jgi:toxin YhaV